MYADQQIMHDKLYFDYERKHTKHANTSNHARGKYFKGVQISQQTGS